MPAGHLSAEAPPAPTLPTSRLHRPCRDTADFGLVEAAWSCLSLRWRSLAPGEDAPDSPSLARMESFLSEMLQSASRVLRR